MCTENLLKMKRGDQFKAKFTSDTCVVVDIIGTNVLYIKDNGSYGNVCARSVTDLESNDARVLTPLSRAGHEAKKMLEGLGFSVKR